MLSKLKQFAKKLWSHLASSATQLFRRIMEPAQPNIVTGTLADLPRSRVQNQERFGHQPHDLSATRSACGLVTRHPGRVASAWR